MRHALGQRQELVDLFLVLCEHQPRFAVVEQIGRFLIQHVPVEAEAQSAYGMRCDFGRDPIGPVVADDADDLATLQSNFEQAQREVAYPRLVVVPGERAPQPKILFTQRDRLAMLAGVEAQELRVGIGLIDARCVIHHAAFSAGAGASSGSTSISSSSPR